MIEQQRGIVTPEAVVLEFETAGVASRALAFAIDLFAMVVLWSVTVTFLSLVLTGGGTSAGSETALIIVNIVVIFLVLFGYPALSETFLRGRTFGKLLCGLRVVTTEGGPVRFRHAALRSIFSVAEIYLTLGTLAVTSIVLTRDNQRLGDVFAGTILLRDRTGESRAIAVRFPAPPGYEEYVMRLDTSGVTRDLYLVVRRFLMRVGELTPAARASLAVELAAPTARRMHHTPPPEISPELFLACVASAYQLRNGAPPLPWERLPGLVPSAPAAPLPPPPPPSLHAALAAAPPLQPVGAPAAAPPLLAPTAPPLPPPAPTVAPPSAPPPPW